MIAMSNNNIEKFDKIKDDGEVANKGNKRRYQRRGKPPYSYVALVAMCIQSSPNKRLRLREILKNIESMFPFFQGDYKGWRDSVRHNLTQNTCFKQILRDPTKPNGKGNYWTVMVESIPGEMYKRQNTSVAYQAPEGKTYAADLREVYDFYTGQSKVSPSGSSIFEHTILQDLNASPQKITQQAPTPQPQHGYQHHHHHHQMRYQTQQAPPPPPPPQQYTQMKFQQYPPFSNPFMDPFFSQPQINQFQYANNFNVVTTGSNNNGSLPHSPSSASSPHSSITGVEFDWANEKAKSSGSESGSPVKSLGETDVVGVVEHLPFQRRQLKRERTQSEVEAAEDSKMLKKCRQELTADFIPKASSGLTFKDLDRCPAPNQVVTVAQTDEKDDPFARRGLRKKSNSPPQVKSVESHKHSIRNILNLDELDGVDGPNVLDPDQINSEQLVRSGAFARLSKTLMPNLANNYTNAQYLYQAHHQAPIFQPYAAFTNFDHYLK